MKVFLSAVIAVLSAQTASAEQRQNKTFSTVNGRTVVSAQAPAPSRIITLSSPRGGATTNAPAAAQAPEVTGAMIGGSPVDGGRSFIGAGRQVASHGSSGRAVYRRGTTFKSQGGRAVESAPNSAPAPAEEAPPHFSKPGALIRTTGQKPVYEKVESRTHTVDAGEIVMNNRKAVDVGRAPSVQIGPKDTPPPPNPSTGSSYRSGAAANTGAGSSGSSGSSGSGSGVGNGGDNNGSGNNDKDKPGDDYDDKGKKNSLETDPTGFNGAF